MYEARQNKEKVSRRIDAGCMARQMVKIGNQKKSTLQRSILNKYTNTFTSIIQKKPYYKVFEYDQLRTGKYVPKLQSNTTYTTLGVRKDEVESDNAGYIKSPSNNPQGMSLLSNINAAQSSVHNPNNNYGLFKLKANLYPRTLSILQDPSNKVHYLWGPKNQLRYNELDGQIKNSQNSWSIEFMYTNGWQKIIDNKYSGKKNKNRRKNMFR